MLMQLQRTQKIYREIAKDREYVHKGHGHIITGDLRLTCDNKSRKIFHS